MILHIARGAKLGPIQDAALLCRVHCHFSGQPGHIKVFSSLSPLGVPLGARSNWHIARQRRIDELAQEGNWGQTNATDKLIFEVGFVAGK